MGGAAAGRAVADGIASLQAGADSQQGWGPPRPISACPCWLLPLIAPRSCLRFHGRFLSYASCVLHICRLLTKLHRIALRYVVHVWPQQGCYCWRICKVLPSVHRSLRDHSIFLSICFYKEMLKCTGQQENYRLVPLSWFRARSRII